MNLTARLLPAPERTFPIGWHDRLIKAAIHADDAIALAHAEAWLLANDIDYASLRDHGLLVEIATRFGPRLAAHSPYPRLVGLRRMLWTRSLMALREAMPALAAIAGAGARMLLLKGAARLTDADQERVVHHIEIGLRSEDMLTAYDGFIDRGWRPAQGVSHHYVREHLASMRGVKMSRENAGDIDLHLSLFHPGQGGAGDDEALWERSRPVLLDGVEVRLASPEDRLALAIAQGGLNGHDNSDWLVDAAGILSRQTVDWRLFEEIVEARSLQAPTLFALCYLSDEAGLPVPQSLLDTMATAAQASPLTYLRIFAQAKPRESATVVDNTIRRFVRLLRKGAARRQTRRAGDRLLNVRKITGGDSAPQSSPDIEQSVAVPPQLHLGRAHFHAILQLAAPPGRRRIELEINSAGRHIGRIRYRKWTRGGCLLTLAIEGPIDIAAGETDIRVVSRPSRLLRHGGDPRQRARYDALPFRCVEVEITQAAER
ncbi:nucleotidyltransferase family protein [Mesorhizobium sp. M0761]|uniref:nucleotidyltransferase family protein n=1 Tax=Mesorhizobium sp. M0761 TaxID=2956994 RepID=UPI0033391F19